jgi:hypothetical protein
MRERRRERRRGERDLELEVSAADVEGVEVAMVAAIVLQCIFAHLFEHSLSGALDVVFVPHVVANKAPIERLHLLVHKEREG